MAQVKCCMNRMLCFLTEKTSYSKLISLSIDANRSGMEMERNGMEISVHVNTINKLLTFEALVQLLSNEIENRNIKFGIHH